MERRGGSTIARAAESILLVGVLAVTGCKDNKTQYPPNSPASTVYVAPSSPRPECTFVNQRACTATESPRFSPSPSSLPPVSSPFSR